jgi:hypothetical protein
VGLNKIGGACFFGYYDKSPWNSNGDTYLCHYLTDNKSVDLIALKIGEASPLNIGITQAWTYQQGAMLQWLPGTISSVIYNTFQNSELGAYIYNINNGSKQFFPWPVQSVHPEGNAFVSLNYLRLMKINSEYGYQQKVSNFSVNMPIQNDGVWLVNIHARTSKLIISIEHLIENHNRQCMNNAEHGINHVMFSPDGQRIIFIHRWLTEKYERYSRLYVMHLETMHLQLLLDQDYVSHYCWLDNDNILTHSGTFSEGKHYYRVNVLSGSIQAVAPGKLDRYGDGHPSLSPDGRWIVTDSYPDPGRVRRLLLWNLNEEYLVEVGKFYSPVKFENERRCDLHPRWHPLKPLISIDSTHEGVRKNYILDVQSITGSFE